MSFSHPEFQQLGHLADKLALNESDFQSLLYGLSPQQRRFFLLLAEEGTASTIEVRQRCSLGNPSFTAQELNGKLDGSAIRVPTPNVSVVDLKFVAKKKTSTAEINAAIKHAADTHLKGVLGYTTVSNVSIDFNHDSHSSVFHMDQTKVIDGTFVRILSWYDNEWGFSNRMSDTAVAMGKLL
jgi:hypothetical protein